MLIENDLEQNELFLYRRQDVSRLLKIGISTLDSIPEKDLPKVRINKSIRYTPEALKRFIQSKETKKGGDLYDRKCSKCDK